MLLQGFIIAACKLSVLLPSTDRQPNKQTSARNDRHLRLHNLHGRGNKYLFIYLLFYSSSFSVAHMVQPHAAMITQTTKNTPGKVNNDSNCSSFIINATKYYRKLHHTKTTQ